MYIMAKQASLFPQNSQWLEDKNFVKLTYKQEVQFWDWET